MDSSVYTKLQAHPLQIRLVLLLPGLDREKLSCRLVTVSLNEVPRYWALSYTWGDPNVTECISLNGHDFTSTTNLRAALWHQRLATRIQTIWIDAICINQNDMSERNQQVQIMPDIYSSADIVVIWLGESSENSGVAMHILEDCSDSFVDHKIFKPSRQSPEAEAALWQPVTDLFQRPYWSRGWIVQEIVLAKRAVIFCGRRYLQWNTLAHSLHNLMNSNRYNYEPFKSGVYEQVIAIRLQRESFKIPECRRQFADYLDMQRFREVSDPRDFVYSISGLTKDILPGAIVPNYSNSVQQVYQNAALTAIRNTKELDILGYVWPHLHTSGFPSWVRDWRKFGHVRPFARSITGKSIYQASRGLQVIWKVPENPDILQLEGFHFDNVAELFEFGGDDVFGRVLGSWKEAARITEEPNRPYIGGSGDFFDAFWRTIVTNLAIELDREKHTEHAFVKAPEKEREIAKMIFGLKEYPVGVNRGKLVNPLGIRIRFRSTNRRMVVSRKGYLGLVPFETERDDLVCVLLGGEMPFILRPKGNYYTLVGECYVHGIMDGEVLEAAHDGSIQLQEFSLQ